MEMAINHQKQHAYLVLGKTQFYASIVMTELFRATNVTGLVRGEYLVYFPVQSARGGVS